MLLSCFQVRGAARERETEKRLKKEVVRERDASPQDHGRRLVFFFDG